MEVVLQAAELACLLRWFNPEAAQETIRRAGLDSARLAAAEDLLRRKGLLEDAGSGTLRPALLVGALVSAMAYPAAVLYTSFADGRGFGDERFVYVTAELCVEDTLRPDAQHCLARLNQEGIAARVCEQWHLGGQPAGSGQPIVVRADALQRAIALARLGESGPLGRAPRDGGLDGEAANEANRLLMELRATSVLAWLGADGDLRQEMGMLDTAEGLWSLQATVDGVRLAPASAQGLASQIHELVAAHLPAMP